MDEIARKELSELKEVAVRLTTIQEIQTDQMASLLENGTVLISLAGSVKDHSTNIVDLYTKLNRTDSHINTVKEDLSDKITDARDSIAKASYAKMILVLTVAIALSWRLFEFNKSDIHEIQLTKIKMVSKVMLIEKELKHIHEVIHTQGK